MRKTLLLLLLTGSVACQQTENAPDSPIPVVAESAPAATDDEALKVMQAMFDAFNRHDLEAMQALYADSALFMSPEMPEPVVGAHHVRTIYGPLFEMAPDVKDEIIHYIHNGDEVAVEFVSTGTVENISPDDPIEMKGRKFELLIFARLKVKDGKIVEDVSYFDQMTFLNQLGLTE